MKEAAGDSKKHTKPETGNNFFKMFYIHIQQIHIILSTHTKKQLIRLLLNCC